MKEKQTKIIGGKLMQGVEKQKPHKSIVASSSSNGRPPTVQSSHGQPLQTWSIKNNYLNILKFKENRDLEGN